jgi:hypothetical protein
MGSPAPGTGMEANTSAPAARSLATAAASDRAGSGLLAGLPGRRAAAADHRAHRGQPDGEALHRALDSQPARGDRIHDGRIGIAREHLMAVQYQPSATVPPTAPQPSTT